MCIKSGLFRSLCVLLLRNRRPAGVRLVHHAFLKKLSLLCRYCRRLFVNVILCSCCGDAQTRTQKRLVFVCVFVHLNTSWDSQSKSKNSKENKRFFEKTNDLIEENACIHGKSNLKAADSQKMRIFFEKPIAFCSAFLYNGFRHESRGKIRGHSGMFPGV